MGETWFSTPSCLNFLFFTLILANSEMCSLSKYMTPRSPDLLQMLACTFSFSLGFLGHCKILLDTGYVFCTNASFLCEMHKTQALHLKLM